MNDENQALHEAAHKPVVVHPGPLSIEDLLQYVDPAPDEEIDRFVVDNEITEDWRSRILAAGVDLLVAGATDNVGGWPS